MADDTIWKLDIQAGNSQATLDAFANSLNMVKDRIGQVGQAGENFDKLASFQTKASEAAAKLQVAQAKAAEALQKANTLANSGTASAEKIATAQANAALAAARVETAENNLSKAMNNVQTESDRLATAMKEDAEAALNTSTAMDTLRNVSASVGEGLQATITWLGDFASKAAASAGEFVSSFQSVETEMTVVEEKAQETSESMLSRFQGAASGIMGFFGEFGLAAMGVQATFQTIKSSIDAVVGPAETYQGILKQTNDVIKSTGDASGMTAKSVADLATSLGETTFFSRDTVQEGENLLLTFTNIGKDVFPQATKTALDMSKALGQDTKSSAIELGKALNDPLTGITALQRVGVTFDTQQKNLIKTYMAHGEAAKAQAIILKELNKEFGGSADATQTFAGKWQILTDKFNDFKENLGMAIMPMLGQLVDFISNMIMPALDGFAGFIQNDVNPAMGALGDFIQKNILPGLRTFWSFVQNNIISVLQDWGKNIDNWALNKLGGLKSFIDQQVMPKLGDFRNYIQNQIIPTLMSWGGNIKNWVTDKLSDLHAFIDKNVMPKLQEFWAFVQKQIVPVLEDWGHNIQVWVLDKLSDLKTFIDQQVMPKLNQFWGFIQNQVIPTLQTWGDNIKKYALDKLNDLKTFIDQQVLPKLHQFWDFIQNQVIPTLQSWGDTIKKQALDKLSDLKTFIDQNVMPALNTFWSFIQNNIIPIFTNWGGTVKGVQDNLSSLKDFIDQHVTPVLMGIWNWINANIIPIFSSLGNILSTDVTPNFGGFTDSVNNLLGALGHLWNAISPVLLPVLGFLAWLVGTQVNNALNGLKIVLDHVVGPAIDGFEKNINDSINVLAILLDNLASVVDWINAIGKALSRLDFGALWSLMTGGPSSAKKPAGGGTSVGSFASGIENFGGGLAFVHANEMLVNLPKGTSVWDPAKTAAFMNSAKALQAPSVPAFVASQGSTSTSSNATNDQVVGLLAGILAELQKHGKVGNVTMNASVTGGSVDAQKLINDLQNIIGRGYESVARGAF